MKRFIFPLQRVMDWRTLQVRAEEEKLANLQQQAEALALKETALTAAVLNSEIELLKRPSIEGSDLQALSLFQERVHKERANLQVRRKQFELQVVEQRKRLLKARRDVRVLEKLKESRLRTWTYLSDRETENTAAESFLAKWAREMHQ
jgi:flagellar export protein FliJ